MTRVLGVDLPWGTRNADRFAWAMVEADGRVLDLRWGRTEGELLAYLAEEARGALAAALLDIPIHGYEWMRREGRNFRPLDTALQSAGVRLFPSRRAGNAGSQLAQKVQEALAAPEVQIHEIYPYAILCVLRKWQSEVGTWRSPWGEPLLYKKGTKDARLRDLPKMRRLLQEHMDFEDVALPAGSEADTLAVLNRVGDAYDACLAALPGLYWLRADPRACLAGDQEHGQLLLLAEPRLTTSLQKHHIRFQYVAQGGPP